jgi:biopolymer transport protein ExbD
MKIDNRTADATTSEMNVTPLIDVLLVLLIIFMVIVPVTPRGDAAFAPQQKQRGGSDESAVVLEVMKQTNGEPGFRINQQAISRQDLPGRLAEIYANRAQRVLFVKGDDQLSFVEIAKVIDMGHAAGIDHVGLITAKGVNGL